MRPRLDVRFPIVDSLLMVTQMPISFRVLRVLVGSAVASLATIAVSAQRGPAADPVVRENATVKLAPHSYAIPDNNVGLVPNVGIVVGSRATLVIDPGLGRRNGETVLREVAKISRNTELYVASTHFHAEHTTGIPAFPASAKYVNSTVQEAEFAQAGDAQIKQFSGFSPMAAELLKDAHGRKADVTFEHDYVLDLGGVRVRFLVVGPTHTRGDTGFFVEGDNVLFAGDVVMNNSFVAANQSSSMKAWLAAFDAFEAMHPTTIVPAHGPIGDGSLIPTLRVVMQAIQARVRELKAQGKSIDEVATTVQMELTAKYPGFARANGAGGAARAAYAEAP
jgi:glyoxylase-like metal-dependent hydrolase (beta-lactamase superfamily II)